MHGLQISMPYFWLENYQLYLMVIQHMLVLRKNCNALIIAAKIGVRRDQAVLGQGEDLSGWGNRLIPVSPWTS